MPRWGSGTTVGIVGWWFSSTIKFRSNGCSTFWIDHIWENLYTLAAPFAKSSGILLFDLGIYWGVHLSSRIAQEHMQGINKTLKREVATRGIEVVFKSVMNWVYSNISRRQIILAQFQLICRRPVCEPWAGWALVRGSRKNHFKNNINTASVHMQFRFMLNLRLLLEWRPADDLVWTFSAACLQEYLFSSPIFCSSLSPTRPEFKVDWVSINQEITNWPIRNVLVLCLRHHYCRSHWGWISYLL